MKRYGLGLLGLLLLIAGYVSMARPWDSATAQVEERVIPVSARYGPFPDENPSPIGEPCRIIDDKVPSARAPYQVVVTNESGTIIAMHSLKGTLQLGEDGKRHCVADAEVRVPEASYYTVYLGEQRLIGYAADAFPIDPNDSVVLSFG